MRHAWSSAVLVIWPLLALAHGCGDSDSTKTRPSGTEAGGASGGEAGEPGNGEAGRPVDGGEAGAPSSSGGEAGFPSTGGAAGEPALGGAPSSGGAGGSGGTGGTNGAVLVGCMHPYGTHCTEFTGSEEDAVAFASNCSNLEMMPLDDCPATEVSGACSWTEGGASFQRFHYELDAEALEEAASDCAAISGTWATP